jgi:hypothetical protein
MKLKNKKHRITNEPVASPLVRLEKKYNLIANAAAAYLQVKEKKIGWFLVYYQLIQRWSWKTNFNKDDSCNRIFSRDAAKKIDKGQAPLLHLSELQSFEVEKKKHYHASCTCSFTASEVKRKKKVSMANAPALKLWWKSWERKMEGGDYLQSLQWPN